MSFEDVENTEDVVSFEDVENTEVVVSFEDLLAGFKYGL